MSSSIANLFEFLRVPGESSMEQSNQGKMSLRSLFSRLERQEVENRRFENKVVIITGASSGIGRACALEFGRAGASVVLGARNISALEEVVVQIRRSGGKALAVSTDVRKVEDCENLMNQALAAYGKIDILINNAGISMRAAFEDLDLKVIKELMDTNFYGTVYCTKFALPHVLKEKGTIIGISSISGLAPLPGRTGYAASKHAMDGFLNTLRVENMKKGLNVLVVHPGFTSSNIRNTALNKNGNPQIETPREEAKMMTSEEVARIISQAVLDRERDLVLTAQGKLVVWLHKHFPVLTDKMILHEMEKEPGSPV